MQSPKFTVVIPTYNQADFLQGALQCLMDQTFRDFEVLVINNYSDDRTLEVVSAAGDPRIKATDFRNNGVIAASRNVGIKSAKGRYIAFLDSDDIWRPNKLEVVSQIIDDEPDAGVFCHNQSIVRYGNVSKSSRYGPPASYQGNLHDYLVFMGNCVATSATVVAKEYLDQVDGFSEDPSLVTVEDYDLWVRISKLCRFRFIDDVLGSQIFHEASASANVELHLSASLAMLEKNRTKLNREGVKYSKGALRRRKANIHFGAARQLQRRGKYLQSAKHYSRSLLANPISSRLYAGLALLLVDSVLGQNRRQRLVKRILPASWPASWAFL